MENSSNHDELAVRARTQEQAFTELYSAYLDPIYAFVMKRVGHKETTEDLVSDIFRKVFLHLNNFDPTKASFRTWIYRISTNTLIDYFRSTKNAAHVSHADLEEVFDVKDQAENPHELQLSTEQKTAVHQLVTKLPERYQQVIQLKYFSECSNQQISEILNLSANNVGVLVHRGLEKLRELSLKTAV